MLRLGFSYRQRYLRYNDEPGHDDVGRTDPILSVPQPVFSTLTGIGMASQVLMALLIKSLNFGSLDFERWFILLLLTACAMLGVMTTRAKGPPQALAFLAIGLAATLLLCPTHGITWPQRIFAVIALGCAPVTAVVFRILCDDDIEDSMYKWMLKIRTNLTKVPNWFYEVTKVSDASVSSFGDAANIDTRGSNDAPVNPSFE